MKVCKKILSVFFACAMSLTVLSACGGEKVSEDAEWEIDKDNHWHLTESGEKTDVASHSLKNDVCSVCGAEIIKEDGMVSVNKYNEQGDTVLYIEYDEDGNITEHKKYEFTYDENDNCIHQKEYDNGRLVKEINTTTFETEEEFFVYDDKIITYNEDGTKLVEEYDENGDLIKETKYKADGTVEYDYTVTNEYNNMDLISSIKKYDGDTIVEEYQHEYDADGNSTVDRKYSYGKLVQEDIYTHMEGYIYVSKTIVYNDDGTKTVTKYDEFGAEIK